MSRRRFDKKNAKTFSVVHRAHDDSKFYDDDASQFVLAEHPSRRKGRNAKQLPEASHKVLLAKDLEEQLALDELRPNEGEAAQYGIFYDDTKYDYMKHLKPIGNTDGVFIEAKSKEQPKKKELNIEDLFGDTLPSETKRKVNNDAYQAIPRELAGFKPDLDPRLREVLEALEDEAYIDENDEDVYGDLLKSGAVDDDEFFYGSDGEYVEGEYSDEYDEWDMDNYEDEYKKYDQDEEEYRREEVQNSYSPHDEPFNEGEAPEGIEVNTKINNAWENDFKKFKKKADKQDNDWDSDNDFEDEEDEVPDLPTFTNNSKLSKTKLRKKKGAMTDTSSFSMSSSANFRTEGLTLLDDRFEQLSKKFEQEEEEVEYTPFDIKKERSDFEGLLDDFLDNYELQSGGRKLAKKDVERAKLQEAADSVSKSKTAAKRKEIKKDPLGSLGSSFSNMKI